MSSRLSHRQGAQQAELPSLPGMRLTTRDAAILLTAYHYRAVTTLQLQALFFTTDTEGNKTSNSNHSTSKPTIKVNTRCQYRLQLLYLHGYLVREEQAQRLSEGRRPYVYSLAERGARFVEELLDGEEFDWHPRARNHKPSPLFMEHLIATNDVRVAVMTAARRYGFKVVTWLDERTLKRRQMTDVVTIGGPNGQEKQAVVIPDGYFLLDTGEHLYSCFLEIDRATSTASSSVWGRRDWARKVAVYLEYYRSGKYQERYKVQGLRVLTVTTGERRLASLKTTTEKAGGRSRFWFTTFERIKTADVLIDPIWEVAASEGLRALTW